MRKDVALLAAVIAIAVGLLAALFLKVGFFPEAASEQAQVIDDSLQLLFAIGAGIFVLILGVMGYSIWRFRARDGDGGDGPPIQSNGWLVAAFLIVPTALVLWSASFGAVELRKVQDAPPAGVEELEVQVTGLQWAWLFQYPDLGITSAELTLPVGRPVLFRITSRDVIHSFWVPEWRPKIDALAGRETELRVTPNRVGEYRVRCAELCGLGHAIMTAPVRVVTEQEFQTWVAQFR